MEGSKNSEKNTMSRADVSLPCGYQIQLNLMKGFLRLWGPATHADTYSFAKTPQQVAIQSVA